MITRHILLDTIQTPWSIWTFSTLKQGYFGEYITLLFFLNHSAYALFLTLWLLSVLPPSSSHYHRHRRPPSPSFSQPPSSSPLATIHFICSLSLSLSLSPPPSSSSPSSSQPPSSTVTTTIVYPVI